MLIALFSDSAFELAEILAVKIACSPLFIHAPNFSFRVAVKSLLATSTENCSVLLS